MVTYMVHPLHGRMPVYSSGDIEQAKVHGWSVEPEAVEKKSEPVQSIVAEPKRRGRPPKAAK